MPEIWWNDYHETYYVAKGIMFDKMFLNMCQ